MEPFIRNMFNQSNHKLKDMFGEGLSTEFKISVSNMVIFVRVKVSSDHMGKRIKGINS